MVEEERNIRKDKIIITIAVLSVVSGLFLISRNYLLTKKEIAYENVALEIYDEDALSNLDSLDEGGVEQDTPPTSTEPENHEENNESNSGNSGNSGIGSKKNVKNNYIGTLEISKIKLKKGFVSPSSKYNAIDYNVTIIKGFDYPDVENGNFILAAHSGTGPLAYFKNLYKLGVGDTAVITYKNKKYTYKIAKIYTQKKQGYLTIYRNVNKTTLTLITCTKDNKKLQSVYIAELV